MTKLERIEAMLSSYSFTEEEKNFLEHEKKLITNRKTILAKPTARQIANDELKTKILGDMVLGSQYQVTDLVQHSPSLTNGESSQKVTALLNQLVADGKLAKVKAKGKTYFSVVG